MPVLRLLAADIFLTKVGILGIILSVLLAVAQAGLQAPA